MSGAGRLLTYLSSSEDIALGVLEIQGVKITDPDCPPPCTYTSYSYTISQVRKTCWDLLGLRLSSAKWYSEGHLPLISSLY